MLNHQQEEDKIQVCEKPLGVQSLIAKNKKVAM